MSNTALSDGSAMSTRSHCVDDSFIILRGMEMSRQRGVLRGVLEHRRWLVLGGAVLIQLALGAIYDWSLFGVAFRSDASVPHLSSAQASIPFEVALGMIFPGAFLGGRLQDRHGPRGVALAGGLLYAAGVLIASRATSPDGFWLLVLGYGVLGGAGVGLAYVTPLSTLQKWFPDRPTLASAVAVAGFGFGGIVTAVAAGPLIAAHPSDPARALGPLALVYAVMALVGGAVLSDPPRRAAPAVSRATPPVGFTWRQAIATRQWWLLTAILGGNVAVSVGFISSVTSAGAALSGIPAHHGPLLVSVVAICNGAGRLAWAALATQLSRGAAPVGHGHVRVLELMLAVQAGALYLLVWTTSAAVFYLVAAIVGLCCGGGFGVMPAATGRLFGLAHAGAIYGLMLGAWSFGGIIGPYLVTVWASPPTALHFQWAFLYLALISGLCCISFPRAIRPLSSEVSASSPTATFGAVATGGQLERIR